MSATKNGGAEILVRGTLESVEAESYMEIEF